MNRRDVLMLVISGALVIWGTPGPGVARCGELLNWEQLPDLPNSDGVAGPFVGVHEDALIVAGGANFPQPVWENSKQWHAGIFVLTRRDDSWHWYTAGNLPRPVAYGSTVSTRHGVVCIGGNDADHTFADVFLLRWDAQRKQVERCSLPSLPHAVAFASAGLLGDTIYLLGGQTGQELATATNNVWTLDLSGTSPDPTGWQQGPRFPGSSRALHMTVVQRGPDGPALYIISGRREVGEETQFLRDVWEYSPSRGSWKQRTSAPTSMMAGVAAAWGTQQIYVLGGADGSMFTMADILQDFHPGFPRLAWQYDTLLDRWICAGRTPRNHVTSQAVVWQDAIVVPSGEIRPRVRSPKVWRIEPSHSN